jgi:hypothetical protein
MIRPVTTSVYRYPYEDLYTTNIDEPLLKIVDHLSGFDIDLKNSVLDYVQKSVNKKTTVLVDYVIDPKVKINYPLLRFKWQDTWVNNCFRAYTIHPEINYKNFVCSFNGSAHVSRKLLVSALEQFKFFNTNYCSKNFSYTSDILDGHISDYVDNKNRFYRKFFISDNSDTFFNTIYSFDYTRFDHAKNIYNLEHKLTQSFLHIVSESLATSYYPFMSEKFLYSVITRGLFLTYAQPDWHEHLEKYYGFRKYTRLFDYRFDSIQNPVERLVELMSMISKFSILSTDDWHDLYEMESDTIEFNYNHYFSGDYLKHLKAYE